MCPSPEAAPAPHHGRNGGPRQGHRWNRPSRRDQPLWLDVRGRSFRERAKRSEPSCPAAPGGEGGGLDVGVGWGAHVSDRHVHNKEQSSRRDDPRGLFPDYRRPRGVALATDLERGRLMRAMDMYWVAPSSQSEIISGWSTGMDWTVGRPSTVRSLPFGRTICTRRRGPRRSAWLRPCGGSTPRSPGTSRLASTTGDLGDNSFVPRDGPNVPGCGVTAPSLARGWGASHPYQESSDLHAGSRAMESGTTGGN